MLLKIVLKVYKKAFYLLSCEYKNFKIHTQIYKTLFFKLFTIFYSVSKYILAKWKKCSNKFVDGL